MRSFFNASLVESIYWFILLLVLLLIAALNPFSSSAQSFSLIISEVYPAPLADEQEWIELLNTSASEVDISGWWLSDELSTPSVIYQFSNSDAVLKPGEFRQFFLSTSKLNNSGDGVRLIDANGTQQSRLYFTESQSGQSQQRTSLDSEQTVRTTPTPNEENIAYPLLLPTFTPTPETSPTPTSVTTSSPSPSTVPPSSSTPTPIPTVPSDQISNQNAVMSAGQIAISEIFACPTDGQPEWIELYNAGATLPVTRWRITDQNGNFRVLNGVLQHHGYSTFSWSGSLLNNAGDTLIITSDQDQILDSTSYTSCSSGKSLILDESDEWVPFTPSPGLANPSLTLSTTPTPTPINEIVSSSDVTATEAQETATLLTDQSQSRTNEEPNVPWQNPQNIQLITQSQVTSPEPTLNNSPQILGTTSPSILPGRPWELFLVIIAGLFLVLAGVLPPYVSTIEESKKLAIGMVAPDPVG